MFSIIGDTILDPFCGEGEEELYNKWGRKFVGYEIGGQ
jgi:DNA modification methylase